MSSEKTEQPTEHKIRKAREDGQVAKSKDFTQTLLMGALLGYMLADSEGIIKNLVEMMVLPSQLYGMEFRDALRILIDQSLSIFVKILMPFILLVIVVGIFSEMIQTGPLLAFKALMPKGDKLNPVSNLQQIFSMKNIVECIKSIIKVCFLSAIIYFVLRDSFQPLILIPASGLAAAGVAVADMLKTLVIYSFIGFGAMSLLDLIWQRYQHIKNLMMSMDEIKQEYKQLEGDPHVKSHRKGLAKEIAMGEMVLKTRKSSVVVTNPTHLAIALYYEPSVTPLPVVLAKGQDGLAFQMVDMAKQYGIPVMQNINLARALMSFAKIDQYIPSDLIEPVAEILVALRRLAENESPGVAS